MAKKVTVKPTQTFLHGTTRYEEGGEYEVSSEEAAYFGAFGWVEGGVAIDGGQDTVLEIENLSVSTDAEEAS